MLRHVSEPIPTSYSLKITIRRLSVRAGQGLYRKVAVGANDVVGGWDIQVIPLFQKVRGRLFSIQGTTSRVSRHTASRRREALKIDWLQVWFFGAGRLGNSARIMVIICGQKDFCRRETRRRDFQSDARHLQMSSIGASPLVG